MGRCFTTQNRQILKNKTFGLSLHLLWVIPWANIHQRHYTTMTTKKILFVCLGNICRSCTAEEVMRTLLRREQLDKFVEVDSAGLISYHQGEQADPRMRAHASRRGYHITHLSRPVRMTDFTDFDFIIGMDDSNISRLHELAPSIECEAKIHRMTEYCTNLVVDHVPDPYYGGAQGFEQVIDILEDACEGLLQHIRHDKA